MIKGSILLIILTTVAVLGASVGGYFWWSSQQSLKDKPLTWDVCIKNTGAIVQQSYPGICRLPDGRSAVQPISEEEKKKLKPPFALANLNCQRDSDCELVIEDSWSNCSLTEICQPIDYSLEKWIAVNGYWYKGIKSEGCPTLGRPSPACDPRPINDNFEAKCIDSVCNKVAKRPMTSQYSCPVNGWINCMPILGPEGKKQCDNVDWFKKNCPNFQGVAY